MSNLLIMAKNEEDTAQDASAVFMCCVNGCGGRGGEGGNAGASSVESPLRHHRNTQREFGFAPSSLFSLKRPDWLISGSKVIFVGFVRGNVRRGGSGLGSA